MKRFSKKELSTEINNGNKEVLVYLSRKYFSGVRRLLRLRGIPDEETPAVFSDVLAATFAGLRRKNAVHLDFESYFMNALQSEVRRRKEISKKNVPVEPLFSEPVEIVAQCISILPDVSRQLLFARVAEKRSFEQIAEVFNFSNAVIAEYEIDKALTLLEGIVRLRFAIPNN